jgi:hypothetical protein
MRCFWASKSIAAHDKALREALDEAENYAAARVRLNGANEDRATANWIVAAYRHDTSRELDPQLHTHAVTANVTFDGVEGRWKALQASRLYERRAYLTEVYRSALAREVHGLGYEIEPRRDSKGRDYGFEICGVFDELLAKYSVRSAQRDAAIERFTVNHGRKPTNNEVAVLVRESRADKLTEISTEKLRKQQQARLLPEESHALRHLHEESVACAGVILNEPALATEALQHAKEHLFERSSIDTPRNELIVGDLLHVVHDGCSPLLLTPRTEHLKYFETALAGEVENVFVVKGGMGKRQRRSMAEAIAAVPADVPRVILATGSYIGEGFDDARLDTLFLAMPISWKGTLQQYVGRLHRLRDAKRVVRVYDYVDSNVLMLARMYARRLKGYSDIGYRICNTPYEVFGTERQAAGLEEPNTALLG